MGTITAFESITLDGVMQAPGRADEDERGGFRHGGWATGFDDGTMMRLTGESMAGTEALLFGRRTYDDLLGSWASAPEPNPFTDVLVKQQKYVASHSATTELAYPNSTLMAGPATTSVANLRDEVEGGITVLGSGELVRSLHNSGLVDGYVLLIHPIVLGSGTPLFGGAERTDLALEESVTTTTGVVLTRYSTR